MPGDDSIELARLLRLADGEECLDPAARAHGLDPDVVAAIDEVTLNEVPSGRGRSSSQTRSARRLAARPVLAIGSPCRSSSRAHPRDVGERPGDPLDAEPSSTARVSTCSASTARCRVSYCSATMRVKIASVIAMNGTGYGTSNRGSRPGSRP